MKQLIRLGDRSAGAQGRWAAGQRGGRLCPVRHEHRPWGLQAAAAQRPHGLSSKL